MSEPAKDEALVTDGYKPSAPIADVETAQRRLDELWTATVARLSVGGVGFLRRSEVGHKHTLVGMQPYRVVLSMPVSHTALEKSQWPHLGKAIMEDVGLGKLRIPRQVLPIATPYVSLWTKEKMVIESKFMYFEFESGPQIEIAKEIPN